MNFELFEDLVVRFLFASISDMVVVERHEIFQLRTLIELLRELKLQYIVAWSMLKAQQRDLPLYKECFNVVVLELEVS